MTGYNTTKAAIRAFLLMVCSGKFELGVAVPKERPHIENLATPQKQEKCSNCRGELKRAWKTERVGESSFIVISTG